MAAEVWGQPSIPPPPEQLGDLVTRFDGWVMSNGSARGHHKFTIGLLPSEKYKALLMADKPGMQLHFEVYLTYQAPEGNDEAAIRKILGLDVDDHLANALDWNDLDGE